MRETEIIEGAPTTAFPHIRGLYVGVCSDMKRSPIWARPHVECRGIPKQTYIYIHIYIYYIYIYMVTPPSAHLATSCTKEMYCSDVQCPLGLQMPCRKHCNFTVCLCLCSYLCKIFFACFMQRKRKAVSDATLSVLKTLLLAVCIIGSMYQCQGLIGLDFFCIF